MQRTILHLLWLGLLASCSSNIVGDPDKPISLIKVEVDGLSAPGRPSMGSVCKGFYLSQQKVRDFYLHAASVDIEDEQERQAYKILPCHARGTAAINGQLYNWIIRAGGVGEFYTEDHQMIKVCGKGCCEKVKGIC